MTNPYGWARSTPGNVVVPPEAKKDNGWNPNEPAAAEYMNWWMDGAAAGAALDRERLLLSLPMINSLAMDKGVGSEAFACTSTIRTYVDRYGVLQKNVPVNEPRFEKNGLLIEGASTNELTRSEDFNDGDWPKLNLTITPNDIAAPDGVATSADKLVETAVDAEHRVSQTVSGVSPNQDLALSVFVKADERSHLRLVVADNGATGNVISVIFDLSDGTFSGLANGGNATGAAATITPLANGWFHVTISGHPNTSGTDSLVRFNLTAGGSASYLGEVTKGLHLWGAQLEELPFASSYIPTVATAVTRTAENPFLTIEGNIPLQADAATILLDFSVLGIGTVTGGQNAFVIVGETNRIIRPVRSDLDDNIWGFYGDAAMNGTVIVTPDTVSRAGLLFDGTTASLWLDGVKLVEDATVDASDALGSKISLGHQNDAAHLFGHLYNLRIYDRALSDEEMAFASYRGAS